MDLSGLLVRFSTGSYSVTREARGTTTRGRVGDGTQTTVTITASVSPVSGNDIKFLPEGRRVEGTKQLFTTTLLHDGGVGSAYEADVISIGGVTYEVLHIEPWEDPTSSSTMYRVIVGSTAGDA